MGNIFTMASTIFTQFSHFIVLFYWSCRAKRNLPTFWGGFHSTLNFDLYCRPGTGWAVDLVHLQFVQKKRGICVGSFWGLTWSQIKKIEKLKDSILPTRRFFWGACLNPVKSLITPSIQPVNSEYQYKHTKQAHKFFPKSTN